MVKTVILKIPSEEYDKSVELRDRVFMKESEKSMKDIDLSEEGDSELVIGAFIDDELRGVAVCSQEEYDGKNALKTDFFTVDEGFEDKGVREGLVIRTEYIARELLLSDITVIAADEESSEYFEKHGYRKDGDSYTDEITGYKVFNMIKPVFKVKM